MQLTRRQRVEITPPEPVGDRAGQKDLDAALQLALGHQVAVAFGNQDVQECIPDYVSDFRFAEGRIRREAASPSKSIPSSPLVFIDAGEVAWAKILFLTGRRVDAGEPTDPPLAVDDEVSAVTAMPEDVAVMRRGPQAWASEKTFATTSRTEMVCPAATLVTQEWRPAQGRSPSEARNSR